MSQNRHKVEKEVNDCYEKYYQSIYRYCYARLGDLNEHAGDCVQETFLVLHRKLSEGIEIEQARAFLYRTADTFVMRKRQEYKNQVKRTVQLDEAEEKASPPIIPDNFDYDKCAAMLISLLSPEERELYDMKYIRRLSLTEIAELLDISPPAAAKRTSRLRQRIKDLIKEKQLFDNEVIL